jgi:type II secretory ATPase GspE/PulE/Tfp pilus assembly ATPase PilB-like protein
MTVPSAMAVVSSTHASSAAMAIMEIFLNMFDTFLSVSLPVILWQRTFRRSCPEHGNIIAQKAHGKLKSISNPIEMQLMLR